MSKTIRRVKNSWRPDLPDFRDHAFQLVTPIVLPQSVDLRNTMPPVYDQLDLGSCTANAIAAAYDYARKKEGKPFITPSRLFVYYNERVMEGTVNEDAGAMIRDGIKSISALGVCHEAQWAYDVSKFATRPSNENYTHAIEHQALSYRRLAPDLRSMQSCLAYGFPFVFGFSVYESFMSDEVASTGVATMPQLTEQQAGGHAVLAVGYDMSMRAFLVRNSWSINWGLAGHFWMPYEYISSPDLADDRWQIRIVE